MSDNKNAMATIATGLLDDIILERNLINLLPKNRKFSLKIIKKSTGYNFYNLRKYVNSEIFTIRKTTLDITENNQLLSQKTKEYTERMIKKFVFPSLYEKNKYIYYFEKLFDNSYYTPKEKDFIDFMFNEIFYLTKIETFSNLISFKDLFDYNTANSNHFHYVVKNICNTILQDKLHVGDNIELYFNKISRNDMNNILDKCTKFDYIFDKNAILKCDLKTNVNIFIKNFLNLIINKFNDKVTRIVLLLKLNSKYPFLIKDKIFNEFN